MSKTLSVSEFVANPSEHMNEVVYHGEHLVLTRGEKVVAEVRPALPDVTLTELADVLRSLPHLSRDNADAFAKDLEEAREELARQEPRDPWES